MSTASAPSKDVPPARGRPPRVLLVSAAIGEGHDLPARQIAAAIGEADPSIRAPVIDGLEAMGPPLTWVVDDGSVVMFRWLNWLFDLVYVAISRFPPTRWLAQRLLRYFGTPGIERLLLAHDPDVVVSTYPGTTDVLGHLRETGRLDVPVVAAITDLAGLRHWAHPGVDLHLTIHPESDEEVRAIAPRSRIVCARGMTAPGFDQPRDRLQARRALGLPETGAIVVVSGGGWAVGDLEGAAEAALAADPAATVIALCGRKERVRAQLDARFADEPRLRTMGFTDRMSDLLAAADVLVHSTAGLTVLEALIRGCRVISYGWGVAHIRMNNAAYERFGLAEVAATRDELVPAIQRAIAEPRPPDESFFALPQAADEVLALLARAPRGSGGAP